MPERLECEVLQKVCYINALTLPLPLPDVLRQEAADTTRVSNTRRTYGLAARHDERRGAMSREIGSDAQLMRAPAAAALCATICYTTVVPTLIRLYAMMLK